MEKAKKSTEQHRVTSRFGRLHLWTAAAVAFLLGFPLSEKVFAGGWDIFRSSLDLGLSIADSAHGS